MILLSLLGVAFGAGGLHFTQSTASDMAGYGLGAGIWTAINLILSMGFGAYVAARLSGTHSLSMPSYTGLRFGLLRYCS